MSVKSEMLNSTWTIRPTSLERQVGRLLRSPEGHEEPAVVEEPKSLVNEPEKTEEVKTEDTKAEEGKTEEKKEEVKTEETKVEPLTVEKLSVPEGFELQPEMANEFLEILNGDQSPEDRANALLALHSKTLTAASEASSEAWDSMQTEWKDAVKADPDIGGTKLQPTLANVGKLVSEFGDDELKGVFDLTGAGNNIHMIKFLNKIANVLTEGNFFKAGTPGGQDDPDAAAKRLFTSATK